MRCSPLAIVLFAAACTQAPYDPDAPAIDPDAPRVHIVTPERGTFAEDVNVVTVTGTAYDTSGEIASVTVNGVAANVAPDGAFSAVVPVTPGTNLLHAVATDAQGNIGKETRAVVAGALQSIEGMVPSAVTMSMSAQSFEAISRGAGTFIQDADLTALVQPMNPVVDAGTTNGQPDCLYGQARITHLDVGAAHVEMAPYSGGLQLEVVLDDVRVDLALQYAASCVDGTNTAVVTSSQVRVAGNIGVGINGAGGFDIAIADQEAQVDNLDIEMSGVPGSVIDLLSLDTMMGPVIGWATERFVVPMLNDSLATLSDTKTLDVLGKKIDVTVMPSAIDFDVTGAIIEVDTELRAQGDSASPGFVVVPNTVPTMDKTQGIQLAIADDAANQLLGSFWAAKGMDVNLDLNTGTYGEVGQLFDRVEISAKLPPFVDASGDVLKLTIGDLMATFKNGEAVATQVAINAELKIKVGPGPDGALRLDVGEPTVFVDVLDEGVDGANQLSNADFETIANFALARAVAFGSGALGAVPLPSAGGVGLTDVGVSQQKGYVVVGGRVQ